MAAPDSFTGSPPGNAGPAGRASSGDGIAEACLAAIWRLARSVGSFAFALCAALLVVISAATSGTAAAEVGDNAWVQEASAAIDAAERRLAEVEHADAPREMLATIRSTAANVREESEACLQTTQSRLTTLESRLEALGEPTDGESPEVGATRQELERERAQLEGRESECRLLLLRAQELNTSTTQQAQALMAERLLARGPHFGEVLSKMLANPGEQAMAIVDRMIAPAAELGWQDAVIAALLLIAGVVAGRAAGQMIAPSRRPEVADCVYGSTVALCAAFARMLPALLAAFAVSLYLAWALEPASASARSGFALTAWLMALTLIRMLLRPPAPAEPFLPLPEALRRSLYIRSVVLSVLVLVGYLAFALIPWQSGSGTMLLFVRALYGAALALNLSWILLLTRNFFKGPVWWLLRGIAWILLLLALGAEWLGYRSLAPYLLTGVTGSAGALILGAILARFFSDLVDGLDEGRFEWQRRVRNRIGLTAATPLPGVIWLRVLFILLVWILGGYLVLLSWGLSTEGTAILGRWLTDGFEIGDVRLVPTQILAAVLIFGLLTTVVRWMRGHVVPGWMGRTRLDTGAREAVVTITSYAGMALAVVIALSMAGIGFQNLAIVAGALSVGIGFGLQNIVNNFVSGLILLFERPIRRGDWIEVGNTQGYVRQISIRSTRLETFDRSEVIIPNAELATTQVINWQLRDSWGRVTVPVSVAYGTDTAKVREILLRIAYEHPKTISGGLVVPEPVVLFRAFGESSLDFELRFFIPQIDERLTVISDINFAVDSAFREQGIEIPFPQRDLHFKSPVPQQREQES